MKLEKKYKIHKAAAKETTRYAIHDVMLDTKPEGIVPGPKLVATNGRVLAIVPVTDAENDTPGTVPHQAIKFATSKATKKIPEATIHANGEVQVDVGDGVVANFKREDPSVQRFPDYECVVPKSSGTRFAINPHMLAALAEAIGVLPGTDCEAVHLELKLDSDGKVDTSVPVLVKPVSSSNAARGVIMLLG